MQAVPNRFQFEKSIAFVWGAIFSFGKMKSSAIYAFLLVFLVQDTFSILRQSTPSCPNLLLKNGKVKRRQRGRFIKFICNPGYMLAGEKFSTCNLGKWDPEPPKCVRPTCMNKPDPPVNGSIYPTHSMAVLHIYCKPGFELRGPADIFCDGKKWDNNMPICLASNTKPKLLCDFEDENLCGWTHDLNHVFNWRRENYKTPSGSIGTGPSFDHTKGPGQDGHYMYIESSSRFENDAARLISPIFDKSPGPICLEFFYHMYGATTGTLKVYVKGVSEEWNFNALSPVFSKSGNQGDVWFRSYLDLGVIDEEYQIVIEGIRGSGYVSDIAIDDVKITENCVYEEMSTTTEVSYSTEAFLQVESCENRCGLKASGNETHMITCDCDIDCWYSSRCCPDYFDSCVLGTTEGDSFSTTDIPNEVFVTSVKPVVPTENRPTVQTTPSSSPRPSTTRTTTTTVKPPSTRPSTKLTPKMTPWVRPTVRLLPQPTQPVIARRTLPPYIAPKKNKTAPFIYVKPKKVDTKNKENESNDVEDVPRPTNSDEELLLTSPLPEPKEKRKLSPLDVEDGPQLSNLGAKDKFYSVKAQPVANYNVVLIVLSVVGVVVLAMVVTVVVVRRYRCNHRRMASSNGDSQSDVRFLTGDEVLDFSLDKNYDSL